MRIGELLINTNWQYICSTANTNTVMNIHNSKNFTCAKIFCKQVFIA